MARSNKCPPTKKKGKNYELILPALSLHFSIMTLLHISITVYYSDFGNSRIFSLFLLFDLTIRSLSLLFLSCSHKNYPCSLIFCQPLSSRYLFSEGHANKTLLLPFSVSNFKVFFLYFPPYLVFVHPQIKAFAWNTIFKQAPWALIQGIMVC